MKVKQLGHAGLLVQTRYGDVLCDPWFGPAFYASWFPFPNNEQLRDSVRSEKPEFLYVSHTHADHFDEQLLAELDKNVTVIVPEFPLSEMREKLQALGFKHFLHTKNGKSARVNGLVLTVFANSSPADGPMGDSSIVIDDGETCIFNQNDSRPHDLEAVKALGPFDAHFAQHSGAVWFPMVYRMPVKAKEMAGRRKRRNQTDRFLQYVRAIDARYVIPNSGPPAFLDDDLFYLNDLHGDPANVFPDQRLALDALWAEGRQGRSMLPGSKILIEPDRCELSDPKMQAEAVFGAKLAYLNSYARRSRGAIEAVKEQLLDVDDLEARLIDLFRPLVARTDRIAEGIGGSLVVAGPWGDVEIDFVRKQVKRWKGGPFVHRLIVERRWLADMVARGEQNWVDGMWPSCRFEAERRGPYNDYVGSFFRCLTPERLEYAEEFYAQQLGGEEEWFDIDGWRVQRRCPHLGSDLTMTGSLEGTVLTCSNHGLRWDLESGRCLDSAQARPIRAERR